MRPGRAVAAVAVAVLLGACTTLPDEGPVRAATSTDPSATSAPFDYNPPGPRPGASPEQVVAGFLNALQATPVTTQVAEQFLTPRAVTSWRPARRTVVYSSERILSVVRAPAGGAGSGQRARVDLELAGTDVLDANGRWVGAESSLGSERLPFRLRRERGEWRLVDPPDAVVIPQTHFTARYRQYWLFFFDPSVTTLVPEPVYVPWGVQAPTQLVNGLLAGPPVGGSPRGGPEAPAVARTFLPPGTRLGVGVPVVDGVADVPLSEEVLGLDEGDLDLALAQLAWTLRQLGEVDRLRVTVEGTPLELPDGGQVVSVSGWDGYSPVQYTASTDLFGLRQGEVRQVIGEDEVTAATLGELEDALGRPRSLGVDMPGQRFALVAEDGSQVAVVTRSEGAGEAQLLPTASALRPMWDHAGTLWVVDRTAEGAAVLVRRSGALTELPAPGLAGRRVVAASLSRDGSRLAAVRRTAGGPQVVVARVLRAVRGTPVRLTPARPVSTGVSLTRPGSLGWRDPTTVAVVTRPARRVARVVLLPADGATALHATSRLVDDFAGVVRTLVATPGDPSVLLLWDRRGRLHALDPQGSWDRDVLEPGLRAPTFVG